jgi:hypothetical protein
MRGVTKAWLIFGANVTFVIEALLSLDGVVIEVKRSWQSDVGAWIRRELCVGRGAMRDGGLTEAWCTSDCLFFCNPGFEFRDIPFIITDVLHSFTQFLQSNIYFDGFLSYPFKISLTVCFQSTTYDKCNWKDVVKWSGGKKWVQRQPHAVSVMLLFYRDVNLGLSLERKSTEWCFKTEYEDRIVPCCSLN